MSLDCHSELRNLLNLTLVEIWSSNCTLCLCCPLKKRSIKSLVYILSRAQWQSGIPTEIPLSLEYVVLHWASPTTLHNICQPSFQTLWFHSVYIQTCYGKGDVKRPTWRKMHTIYILTRLIKWILSKGLEIRFNG